jgi:hypothetical protein
MSADLMPEKCVVCGRGLYRRGHAVEGKVMYQAKGMCTVCYRNQADLRMTPAQAASALVGFITERRRRGIPSVGTMTDKSSRKDSEQWIEEYRHVRSLAG